MPVNLFILLGIFVLSGTISLLIALRQGASEINVVRMAIGLLWTALLFAGVAYVRPHMANLMVAVAFITLATSALGTLFVWLAPRLIPGINRSDLSRILLFALAFYCLGMPGFCAVLYALSESSFFFEIGATLGFPAAVLMIKSFDLWLAIPPLKYKSWVFPVGAEAPKLFPIDTIRLHMNFTPVPGEGAPEFEGYEVEFPTNVILADLFHYFVLFHNKHREYRKRPLQYMINDQPLSWLFYTLTPSGKKRYLDYEQTLPENGMANSDLIFAESIKQY